MAGKSIAAFRKRRDAEFIHGLNRILVLLIGVASLAAIGAAFYPEWTRRNHLAAQLEALKVEHAEQSRLAERQLQTLKLLETDPEFVEVIARDKLGMMKEGETIFRLDGSH